MRWNHPTAIEASQDRYCEHAGRALRLTHSDYQGSSASSPREQDQQCGSRQSLSGRRPHYLEVRDHADKPAIITYQAAIDKDNRKGLKLHAAIETCPEETVVKIARDLDEQRRSGVSRSPALFLSYDVLHDNLFALRSVELYGTSAWHPCVGQGCLQYGARVGNEDDCR